MTKRRTELITLKLDSDVAEWLEQVSALADESISTVVSVILATIVIKKDKKKKSKSR